MLRRSPYHHECDIPRAITVLFYLPPRTRNWRHGRAYYPICQIVVRNRCARFANEVPGQASLRYSRPDRTFILFLTFERVVRLPPVKKHRDLGKYGRTRRLRQSRRRPGCIEASQQRRRLRRYRQFIQRQDAGVRKQDTALHTVPAATG